MELDVASLLVKPFLSTKQNSFLMAQCNGEAQKLAINKLNAIAQIIDDMPKSFEQVGKGDQAIAYLHYSTDDSDWFITEKNADGYIGEAFGYTILNGRQHFSDPNGKGLVSIFEITRHGAELDLEFTPCTIAEVKSFLLQRQGEQLLNTQGKKAPDVLNSTIHLTLQATSIKSTYEAEEADLMGILFNKAEWLGLDLTVSKSRIDDDIREIRVEASNGTLVMTERFEQFIRNNVQQYSNFHVVDDAEKDQLKNAVNKSIVDAIGSERLAALKGIAENNQNDPDREHGHE